MKNSGEGSFNFLPFQADYGVKLPVLELGTASAY
jgi:hypothetical protein